jgi:hypothetical protein
MQSFIMYSGDVQLTSRIRLKCDMNDCGLDMLALPLDLLLPVFSR